MEKVIERKIALGIATKPPKVSRNKPFPKTY